MCSVDGPPRPDAPTFFDAPADADVTAPMVLATTPVNAATGVARTTSITVEFTEPVFGVDSSSFVVSVNSNPAAGTITPQSASLYVFTPSTLLDANATVVVTLSTAIADYVGNPFMGYAFSFATGS